MTKVSYRRELNVPNSRKDKNEGAMDKAKGRMKEAGGSITGTRTRGPKGALPRTRALSRRRRVLQRTC